MNFAIAALAIVAIVWGAAAPADSKNDLLQSQRNTRPPSTSTPQPNAPVVGQSQRITRLPTSTSPSNQAIPCIGRQCERRTRPPSTSTPQPNAPVVGQSQRRTRPPTSPQPDAPPSPAPSTIKTQFIGV